MNPQATRTPTFEIRPSEVSAPADDSWIDLLAEVILSAARNRQQKTAAGTNRSGKDDHSHGNMEGFSHVTDH